MTHEDVEAIAQVAAGMYGQVWATLPTWSRDIWREIVRHDYFGVSPIGVSSDMERCVVQAKKKWRDDQEGQAQEAASVEQEAQPEEVKPEKKSKKK